VAPYADYVFLSCGSVSEEEARDVCRRMKKAGCRKIIATRGSHGAVYYDGEQFLVQPPKLVKAVDTLGAGDSFAAAFLLSVLKGETADRALPAGAEFAAKTCLVQGAFGFGKQFE